MLGLVALLAGVVAVYVPATRVSAEIDSALQREEDVVADSLKMRLLADAEEDVQALAGATTARALDDLRSGYGESMRQAVKVSGFALFDATGAEIAFFGSIDTPSGLARTTAARRLAQQAAVGAESQHFGGFVLSYGQVYVTAAARVALTEADGGSAEPAIAVTFTRVEHSVLSRLSQDYRLRGLDFSQDSVPDKNALPLADNRGGIVGYLVWSRTSPTETMLRSLGPWFMAVVAAVTLILTLLVLLAMREHRRAAAAQLATEVVVKSERAKSMLFANLSHEFRTPLNAVIGFADVMRLRMFGSLGHAKYAEYVDDIHASASHLLTLIEDVLMLSRYEANEAEQLDAPVSLGAAVDDVRRMLAQTAADKGLTLQTDIAGSPMVLASEKAIRQIVTNLVGNAIKYTERGTIRIGAGTSRLGKHVWMTVTDSGIGIPKEHLNRILSPFEQVDDVYARKQGGTGLGLSIVGTILARAGGKIRIESEPGVGTRVSVTLRRADTGVASANVPHARAA
ncbi:MAG: HAMP domain-containing histidine kinase [Alphaproteobacteria bacterium]|nr:HAMP domain-containing histidine kinase [Alphaproteobacteria bacterium]